MQRRACAILIVPAVVLLLTSGTLGAARVKSIQLSTGVTEDGLTAVDVRENFDPETGTIHSIVLLEDVRANSVLRGVWISIDAISVPNYPIDSVELKFKKKGPASAHLSLSRPTNGWPPGNYRLEVYVDGQPMGSKPFSILRPAGDNTPTQTTPPPAAGDQEQIRKKLEALETAHDAGILSDQEYAAKKATLEAQLQGPPPALDEETRKRLDALDSAYQAGILSEQEYQQKKSLLLGGAGPARPVEQAVAQVPAAAPGPAPTQAAREGRTYSHPAGFSFWYPASWNVTDQDGTLQLVPPDAATSPQGPLELFFLATESVAGQAIREPTDESVIKYLDEQVKSLSPVLEYTRQPSAIQTNVGKGAVLVWQATAPDGRKITARVFVTFAKERAVMLIGMGLKERIDARDKDLQDVFKSITTGQIEAPPSTPVNVETAQAQPQEPPVSQPVPEQGGVSFDQQVKALEAAKEAGVLSEQEFAAKREDLERKRLQTLDSETSRKLQALQTAHQTGVLTDEEYALKRSQLLGQSPLPATPAGTQTPGAALPAKTDGKTYRHVIGFSFWYPADWTVKELQDTLQLVPPDPGTTAQGEPTEVYFLIGDSVAGEGISRADDPRVAQYVDQAVTRISPVLRRTAAPAPKAMINGQGVVMNWEGTSPTGNLVCARAYVSIIKDYGVALVGLCLKERLERRDAILQRIFASFSFGAGQLDQQLCGKWTYLTTQSMTNWSPFETSYSRAQMASDKTGTLSLQSDGSWTRTDRTQMLAGAAGVWLESDQTKVNKGRWYAGGGSLYLIWEDNSWEDYKYEVHQTAGGIRLLLVSGQKGELWEKAN
jgi:hypothetical protein